MKFGLYFFCERPLNGSSHHTYASLYPFFMELYFVNFVYTQFKDLDFYCLNFIQLDYNL